MYQTINYKTLTIKEKVTKKLEQVFNLVCTITYLITGYATYESDNKIVATAGVILLIMAVYRILNNSLEV